MSNGLPTRTLPPRLHVRHAVARGAVSAWRGERGQINYITAGPSDGKRILLVHGFGASSYHWRYQAGFGQIVRLDECIFRGMPPNSWT